MDIPSGGSDRFFRDPLLLCGRAFPFLLTFFKEGTGHVDVMVVATAKGQHSHGWEAVRMTRISLE